MNKAIKWVVIVGGGLVVLVIIALLIVPSFVDLQSYKPKIERMVSEATGRPCSEGTDKACRHVKSSGSKNKKYPSGFSTSSTCCIKGSKIQGSR